MSPTATHITHRYITAQHNSVYKTAHNTGKKTAVFLFFWWLDLTNGRSRDQFELALLVWLGKIKFGYVKGGGGGGGRVPPPPKR